MAVGKGDEHRMGAFAPETTYVTRFFSCRLCDLRDPAADRSAVSRLHHPTISLFVFFKYFAGIGASSFHVIFMGFDPSCFT